MGVIRIYNEDVSLRLQAKRSWYRWLKMFIEQKGYTYGALNYILCSDSYLIQMNREYLSHDTYTDVITFDYTEDAVIQGDIFVSLDRVRDNAQTYGVDWQRELARVFAHGALHLMGYQDHQTKDIQEMRQQEELALTLFDNTINLT